MLEFASNSSSIGSSMSFGMGTNMVRERGFGRGHWVGTLMATRGDAADDATTNFGSRSFVDGQQQGMMHKICWWWHDQGG